MTAAELAVAAMAAAIKNPDAQVTVEVGGDGAVHTDMLEHVRLERGEYLVLSGVPSYGLEGSDEVIYRG